MISKHCADEAKGWAITASVVNWAAMCAHLAAKYTILAACNAREGK